MKHKKQKIYVCVESWSLGDHIKHIHVDSIGPPEGEKNISIVHSVNILMKMGAKLQNYEIRLYI